MKLAHFDFENTFEIEAGRINVLVVESEEKFFGYCAELFGQIGGASGNFCLSDREEMLSLSQRGAVIYDYFDLRFNERKFQSKLYRELQAVAEQNFLREYQQLREVLSDFLAKLNAESECPIDYNEDSGMTELFKSFGVCIQQEETLLDNLLLYMRVCEAFFGIKCFFLFNLKTVLTERQLLDFYHETELMDVGIFLLENVQKPKLKGEIVTIIDRDLCEIVA